MRKYLRLGSITFSRGFLNTLRESGFIVTRRDRFQRNGILVNHGNGQPITIGRKVSRFYIINNPDAISYCSSKTKNYRVLSEFYPKQYTSIDDIEEYPVMLKPNNGHQGIGIKKCNNEFELRRLIKRISGKNPGGISGNAPHKDDG